MVAVAFRTLVITVGGNRTLLRLLYLIWRAFPYCPRRLVTTLFIKTVLLSEAAVPGRQPERDYPTSATGKPLVLGGAPGGHRPLPAGCYRHS